MKGKSQEAHGSVRFGSVRRVPVPVRTGSGLSPVSPVPVPAGSATSSGSYWFQFMRNPIFYRAWKLRMVKVWSKRGR